MKALLLSSLLAIGQVANEAPKQEVSPAIDSLEPVVEIRYVDGQAFCTLIARDESLSRLLTKITDELGWELLGFEGIRRAALVSAELRDRPLFEALESVLGSVGLRPRLRTGTLSVEDAVPVSADRSHLFDLAAAAYARAQSNAPAHELAPLGRIHQGEVEQQRGNDSAALQHYTTILERYATSIHVPEALLQTGLMNQRLEKWAEASASFRELLSMSLITEYHERARYQLARCLVKMDNPKSAIHLLNVLDKSHPATKVQVLRERKLVRAEAHLMQSEPMESLRLLERLEGSGLDQSMRVAVHRLRAAAFEQLDMLLEASRAWVIYSRDTVGQERELALERAARLALQVGDDLGVLFLYEQLSEPVLRARLAPLEREARENLGLPIVFDSELMTPEEAVNIAEEWLDQEMFGRASTLLERLVANQLELELPLALRLHAAWSRCLVKTESLDIAVEYLSSVRSDFEDSEWIRDLDLHAAELLETNGRVREAVFAYEGDY